MGNGRCQHNKGHSRENADNSAATHEVGRVLALRLQPEHDGRSLLPRQELGAALEVLGTNERLDSFVIIIALLIIVRHGASCEGGGRPQEGESVQ